MKLITNLKSIIGIKVNTTSHLEKFIASVGALFAIYMTFELYGIISEDIHYQFIIAASIGSSAVLLFSVPHGQLSKPWPVLGGQILSAVIGVTCYKVLSKPILAGAFAVGLSILCMFYLRCMHPPGGATALFAVIGGENIYQLGYEFVLFPIGILTIILLVFAELFNVLLRRYSNLSPKLLNKHSSSTLPKNELTQEDFVAALKEMDTFIDVTPEDLRDIFALAIEHAGNARNSWSSPEANQCYSNGKLGSEWAIRKIIHVDKRKVKFLIVAGKDRGKESITTKNQFDKWSYYKVQLKDGQWQRICC